MRKLFLFLSLSMAVCGQTAADLFNDSVLHEIRIEINPKDLKALIDNYTDNTYYPANVTWKNVTVENVGVRSKGRTSRRAEKPGLRVDIDRYEEQRFLGLKSFLLDNNVQDHTAVKEPLCMQMFRRMGLTAPREAHARVFVNDDYYGVYALVESTDKIALKQWFDDDEGYLYEWVPMMNYHFGYLGTDPNAYSPIPFKPETREKDPDPKPLEAMLRAINQSSKEQFLGEVGKYLDIKRFLTHVAVESYMAEWDGILASDGVNNLYFYRFKDSQLGYVLPKDKDNSLRSPDYPMLDTIKKHVLMRRLMEYPEMQQFYTDEILRAASIAGDAGGWLEMEMDRMYGRIRDAIRSDSRKECQSGACPVEQSNELFEAAFDYIRGFARTRRSHVEKELRAEGYPMRSDVPPEVSSLQPSGAAPAGSTVVLTGRNLARHSLKATSPWPVSMGGTRVEIGGRPAPLLRVSPEEIEFEIPRDLPPGSAIVVVNAAGGPSAQIAIEVREPVEAPSRQ
jgi:hypothetical protein